MGGEVGAHLPLPRAMTWSPPSDSREKKDGIHCMSCSEENPKMAQFVKIDTNTMTLITSYQTPMCLHLRTNMGGERREVAYV